MSKTKVVSYLQSIIAIPMLSLVLPISGVMNIPENNVNNKVIEITDSVITTQEDIDLKEKADKIDAFFASKNAPLEGYGMKFVIEAEKNNIDWRLLPSIAMRETTGGKFSCKNPKAPNNNFGWFSCKSGFESVDKSIEHISSILSGNNPKGKYYKKGMTSEQILKKYNPDTIVKGYSKQVIAIMKAIDNNEEII